MKITKYISAAALGVLALGISSCENDEITFPDFDGGTTVYFANQYPVRTIVLGNDEHPNELDQQHKCAIYATMGGAYTGKDITLSIAVDNSLCDNLFFANDDNSAGDPVVAMPSNYYSLASNQIVYNEMNKLMGKVEVQLTDAFFNDPKAIQQTYVIPVVIKDQKGANGILTGKPMFEGATPARCDADAWQVLPKDYVLYCVKFINPWDATYIRRGLDKITENGVTTDTLRHSFIFGGEINAGDGAGGKGDELNVITTKSLNEAVFPVSVKTSGASVSCDLLLSFNGDNCTISSATSGVKASGTGKFVTKGAPQAWGCKDRDVLYLDYNIDFGQQQVVTKDTLVVQTRNMNKKVTFTTKYVK